MDIAVPGAIFVVSIILLVRSGGVLVGTLSRIAAFLEVPEYVVAFVLMGFATSAPEIVVSILAAVRGDSIIAFGNNIGSNIFYPTILIGLAAIMARHLVVRPSLLKRENLYASLIAFLPFVFLTDLVISRIEGLILAGVFVWYIGHLLGQRRVAYGLIDGVRDGKKDIRSFFRDLVFFAGGAAVLIISSEGVVRSTTGLAEAFGMPLFILSTVLVAGGVALPELSFSLRAVMQGKTDMVLGNMFGSLATNSGLALGAASLVSPITIGEPIFMIVAGAFAAGSLALFGVLAATRAALSWREGLVLAAVYIAFIGTMLAIAPRAL